jgi:hypothetical protein
LVAKQSPPGDCFAERRSKYTHICPAEPAAAAKICDFRRRTALRAVRPPGFAGHGGSGFVCFHLIITAGML